MKLKKIVKEVAIFIVIATLLMNVMSYIRKPKLEFDRFPTLHATLIDGSKFSYKEFENRAFIVHFWATWCPVCKAEISNFQRLKDDGYEVLSVVVESGSDDDIKSFMKKRGLDFRVINDKNGNLAKYFKIEGYPTTFVFDKDGGLFFSDVGYTSDLSLKLKVWLSSRF